MALDVHAINLLRYAARRQPLKRVATMGRQAIGIPPHKVNQIFGLDPSVDYGEFCERFLEEQLGATKVESFDYSDFEGATHIVDLNAPIGFRSAYDTIVDAGTTEHVFNATQSLKNISQLCSTGGQLLHILPANNLCNHGFWQFSPELFFSLYSEANGYSQTQVFLADVSEATFWYEARPPHDGCWDYFASSRAMYVLVRTVKASDDIKFHAQQAAYVNAWKAKPSVPHNKNPHGPGKWKTLLEGTPFFKPAQMLYRLTRAPDATLKKNAHLIKMPVTDMF